MRYLYNTECFASIMLDCILNAISSKIAAPWLKAMREYRATRILDLYVQFLVPFESRDSIRTLHMMGSKTKSQRKVACIVTTFWRGGLPVLRPAMKPISSKSKPAGMRMLRFRHHLLSVLLLEKALCHVEASAVGVLPDLGLKSSSSMTRPRRFGVREAIGLLSCRSFVISCKHRDHMIQYWNPWGLFLLNDVRNNGTASLQRDEGYESDDSD